MTDTKPAIQSAFAYLAEQRPDYTEAFKTYFGAAYRPQQPVLTDQSRVLVFLVLLAAAGSVESFRIHLNDAEKAGLGRDEIIEALLLVAPVFGYQRVLGVVGELREYSGGN